MIRELKGHISLKPLQRKADPLRYFYKKACLFRFRYFLRGYRYTNLNGINDR